MWPLPLALILVPLVAAASVKDARPMRSAYLAPAPGPLLPQDARPMRSAYLVRHAPVFDREFQQHDLEVKETLQSSQTPTEDILRWAARNGATVSDSLTVNRVGLTIKKETPPGTVLLSVPMSLHVHSDNASKSSMRQIFQKQDVPLAALDAESHELRLTVALLALSKAGRNEKMAEYMSSLPTPEENSDHNVYMAQTGLLVSFQDLPISETVRQYQLDSQKRFEDFKSMGGRAQANDWEWADSLVRTKAFQNPHGGLMLVPVVDLIGTTLDASRQNVEIVVGDGAGGAIQVRAKRHLSPGMELLGPTHGTPAMREETVSSRGDAAACSRLSQAVTNVMKGYNASANCAAQPAQVSQKVAFCTLAGIAAMGCSECTAFPCKDNFCTCGGSSTPSFVAHLLDTVQFDFSRASAERPLLVSICLVLGVVLVVIRSFRLLDATKRGARRDRSHRGTSSSASLTSQDSDGSDSKQKNIKSQKSQKNVKSTEGGLNLDSDVY